MGKSSLPPGFRFNPTDVELVQYYLKRKIMGKKHHVKVIAEVDIYKWAPWDLPDKSCWRSGDLKWYFFTPVQKKYASGGRMNRATDCGYWKTTGKDRSVIYNTAVVGWIKTLIFHTGRAPQGERTNWVLHEYRLDEKNLVGMDVHQDSYVLSIIFQKDGIGPRNNKQYGAPFKEEDWTDDEDETDVILHASMPDPVIGNRPDPVIATMHAPDLVLTKMPAPQLESANMAEPTHVNSDLTEHELAFGNMPDPCLDYLNTSQSDIVYPNTPQPDLDHANMPQPSLVMPSSCNVSLSSHGSCVSDILSPSNNVLQFVSNNYATTEESHLSIDDDILLMLECFTEEETSLISKNKEHHNLVYSGDAAPIGDIYRDLGGLSKDGYPFPSRQYSVYTPDQIPPGENEPFLELLDLDKPLDGNNSLLSQQGKESNLTSTFLGGTPHDDSSFFSWEGDI